MFDAKEVVIDGRGHLLGRLASIVAKELLNGQKVAVVRCEELMISGGRKFESIDCDWGMAWMTVVAWMTLVVLISTEPLRHPSY